MACALRMATKKYEVTIYEKSDRAGGTLLELIDPAIVEDDFALQMQFLNYDIIFNTEITSPGYRIPGGCNICCYR